MNRPIQWQKGSLFCINCAYNIQIYTENFAGIYAYCVRFHMYLCMCVCISQPNFTLNWPYAFINAIQCYACVYVHVWSIPSQSRFINLMPFRFHFVWQNLLIRAKIVWNPKPIYSHKEFIKIMQFRLISLHRRVCINDLSFA